LPDVKAVLHAVHIKEDKNEGFRDLFRNVLPENYGKPVPSSGMPAKMCTRVHTFGSIPLEETGFPGGPGSTSQKRSRKPHVFPLVKGLCEGG
jgi:hypothetical protein